MIPHAPLVHHRFHSRDQFATMEKSGRLKNAFRTPDNLSIFTAHNYTSESLLERNLNYLGVDLHVINRRIRKWSNYQRVRWFLQYMKDVCTTDYVLHLDAKDVILRDNPMRIVEAFSQYGCDLLYCATKFNCDYKCMPLKQQWADFVHFGRYLNAGVWMGRRAFAIDVYENVMGYLGNGRDEHFYRNERRFAKKFPHGVTSDQAILRYLEPIYHPQLAIDMAGKMVCRNGCKIT